MNVSSIILKDKNIKLVYDNILDSENKKISLNNLLI